MANGSLSRQARLHPATATAGAPRVLRAAVISAIMIPALLGLAGCGGEEIQLEGKIFDVVGLGANSKKEVEPKLAERPPLVLPPNNDRLPEPGTPPESVAADVDQLNDPDKKVAVSKAELEKQQAAYCKVHYEEAKARGDDNADLATGPTGPCKPSVITAIEKWNKGE